MIIVSVLQYPNMSCVESMHIVRRRQIPGDVAPGAQYIVYGVGRVNGGDPRSKR
jgi:hypothetical protein